MKTLLVLLLSCSLLLFARAGHATPNFPAAVESDLGLGAPPACTLCHVGEPGLTTATTPFALSLRARGVGPFDTGTLGKALAELEADGTDSDGDCAPDIAELKANGDPNVSNGGSCGPGISTIDPPKYGCGAHVASRTITGDDAIAISVLGLIFLARRRVRRW